MLEVATKATLKTGLAIILAGSFVSAAVHAQDCPPAKITENSLNVLDQNGLPTRLKKRGQTYILDDKLFDPGTRVRFVGKFNDQGDDDVMVAVKIVGTSNAAKKDTNTVYLYRPAMNGRKKFPMTPISLEEYSKHHFPENNIDVSRLKYGFHTNYRIKNNKFRTDDSDKKRDIFSDRKREIFVFDGVGNRYKGGLAAQAKSYIFPPAFGLPRKKKFVYLQAEIRNLRPDPCFEFSTYVREDVELLTIEIKPIDPSQKNLFRNRTLWNLEK
jgi:hypothetical protein